MVIGNEHRLAGYDAEDMGNTLSKKGYTVAVASARVANEKKETNNCTSGAVFIAVRNNVARVFDSKV